MDTQTQQITLYSCEGSPFAQRARIALKEANAPYTEYEIDLQNKPEWYAPKVNPASKVPAMAYGGPKGDPADPSPESFKIAESLIILEFIADLFPAANLYTNDPVQRSQVRFFINTFSNKFVDLWCAFLGGYANDGGKAILEDISVLQELLVKQSKGPYFLGEQFSAADAAVAPFLQWFKVVLENGLGSYKAKEGKALFNELFQDAKFSRFAAYLDALLRRESVKETFPTNKVVTYHRDRFGEAK